MPRLSRLRFVSIGHRQARMDDLTLDLRDESGNAMDSTIWLRNGGGKSSLLNLFFALVRPDRREFLGGKAEAKKRRLEDYVLAEDRAVVAGEWDLDTPAGQLPMEGLSERLITGAFYEWRTGASSDLTPLRRLFFAARIEPGEPRLTLEGLPLFVNQHNQRTRRTQAGFRQEWSALRERYPHLQPMYTESLREWTEYLDAAGIDPELFAYQIRMNQREGGVDEIFRFEEDEQFIDFLLELVLDPTFGDKVTRNIDTYRRELKERKDRLIPERDLLTGLSTRFAPLIDIAGRRVLIEQRAGVHAHTFSGLSHHVESRITTLDAAAEVFESARAAETELAEDARQRAETSRLLAAALRLFAATRRHTDAGDRLERLRRDMAHAAEQYQIWDAAVPLHNALRFEKQAEGHRKELERKRSEYAPIMADLQAAARSFAQTLDHRIARLRSDASGKDAEAIAARKEATDSRAFATECRTIEAGAKGECLKYEGFIDKSRSERKRLETMGAIREGESGANAVARFAEEIGNSEHQITQLVELVDELRERRQTLQPEREQFIREASQSDSRRDDLTKRLDEATTIRRQLEASPVIRRCLELETVDLERLPDQTLRNLDEAARTALDEIIRIATDRADDDRAASFLAEIGLLPPTRDVERVLTHLKSKLPAAWSGWSYIESNVTNTPGARRSAVERLPELATGVIVRDADFEKACDMLAGIEVAPETAVVVAAQSAFETIAPTNPVDARRYVIGPSTDAHFDRSVAQTELLRRRARLQEYEGRERQQRELRADVEDILHRLRDFRRLYPRGWFSNQEDAIRHETTKGEGLLSRANALGTAIARLDNDSNEAESRRTGLTTALAQQRIHQARVEDYVRQSESQLQSWHNDLANAQRVQSRKGLEATRWDTESTRLEDRAIECDKAARAFSEEARVLEEERRGMKYIEGDITPAPGPVDEYRDNYRRLQSTYEMNVGAEGLLLLQNQAQDNARDERRKLDPKLTVINTEARALAALSALEDPSQVETLREKANSANQTAQGLVGQQTQTLKESGKQLDEAKATCQKLGKIPDLAPDELPAGPIQAESDAQTIDATIAHDEASAATHAGAAATALHNRDQAKQSAALLRKDADQIHTIQDTYADVFQSGAATAVSTPFVAPTDDDQIGPAIRESEKAVKEIKAEINTLNNERERFAKALRAWASESRFEALKNLIARQFANSDDAELETHAHSWRQQLDLRVTTIEAQLNEMNQHRDILITEVLSAAEEGVTLLKSAATQSRLPPHVPGLGGQQFLRITTHEPDDHGERRGRIGALIDELLDEDDVPTGLALVQRSVSKLTKPIRVKVLNPDPDLAGVPVDITDMARFSGGEQLTGAILLYCTLAQLRSRTRGQQRKPSSVLILDNPIGRASRVRFLELQREVARAMGVQLIYTTAVNDHEALRTLPNIIRLRNIRFDRNRGHRALEHDTPDSSSIQSVRIARTEQPQVPDAH